MLFRDVWLDSICDILKEINVFKKLYVINSEFIKCIII